MSTARSSTNVLSATSCSGAMMICCATGGRLMKLSTALLATHPHADKWNMTTKAGLWQTSGIAKEMK